MEPIQGLDNLNMFTILEKLKQVPMEGRTVESLYLPGYERILDYFDDGYLSENSPNKVELKAQLVGSWLPCCFRTYGNKPDREIFFTDPFSPTAISDVQVIADWMHSLAGASKILHFDRPEEWPMFDRTVCASIVDDRIEYTAEGYVCFAKTLHNILNEMYYSSSRFVENTSSEERKAFTEIVAIVHVGKEYPTHIRALEFALYLIGLEIQKKEK